MSSSTNIKWIVSSRNWSTIGEELEGVGDKTRLSLELNAESVSTAVNKYIGHQVHKLALKKKYDDQTKKFVQEHLSLNANGTFLWVALVCQSLDRVSRRNTSVILKAFPPGLEDLYERMFQMIRDSVDHDLMQQILALATVVYRPITRTELISLVDMPEESATKYFEELIIDCDSFLTLRDDTIYLVHQSATEFVCKKMSKGIFPHREAVVHYHIYFKSLEVMSRTLKRNKYRLHAPGFPIERVQAPDPDPLANIRYLCIRWAEHFVHWTTVAENTGSDLHNGSMIDQFLRKKYLCWLEALSLLRNVSSGVLSIAKLEEILKVRCQTITSFLFLWDSLR